MWYVYILECKDGSLYTGIAKNVRRRFLEHKSGKGGRYTRSHGTKRLVYTQMRPTQAKALRREAEIKSWPRDRKLELIRKGIYLYDGATSK